jgi:hypothetical protein
MSRNPDGFRFGCVSLVILAVSPIRKVPDDIANKIISVSSVDAFMRFLLGKFADLPLYPLKLSSSAYIFHARLAQIFDVQKLEAHARIKERAPNL